LRRQYGSMRALYSEYEFNLLLGAAVLLALLSLAA
jgi:hypothetical protein